MSEDKKLPSKGRMAFNYAKAKGRQFKHVLKGEELHVEDDEYEERMTTCRGCDDWFMYDEDGEPRCSHASCGCFLKEKASFVTESCPIGAWPGEAELEEYENGEG